LPLAAAVVTLVVIVGLYAILFQVLWPPGEKTTQAEEVRNHLVRGRRAIDEKNVALAVKELRAADGLAELRPQALPPGEVRQLRQLMRQVELLENLLPDGLSPRLVEWRNLKEEDLPGVFDRYRGKALLLDLDVSRDAAGQYTYERHMGPEVPRLGLGDLRLLQRLPLAERQRLLFGCRMTALSRDNTRRPDDLKRWLVSFDADSAVLITDAAVAEAAHLTVDPELRSLLDRQAAWLAALP
jgi:hypothetical protein